MEYKDENSDEVVYIRSLLDEIYKANKAWMLDVIMTPDEEENDGVEFRKELQEIVRREIRRRRYKFQYGANNEDNPNIANYDIFKDQSTRNVFFEHTIPYGLVTNRSFNAFIDRVMKSVKNGTISEGAGVRHIRLYLGKRDKNNKIIYKNHNKFEMENWETRKYLHNIAKYYRKKGDAVERLFYFKKGKEESFIEIYYNNLFVDMYRKKNTKYYKEIPDEGKSLLEGCINKDDDRIKKYKDNFEQFSKKQIEHIERHINIYGEILPTEIIGIENTYYNGKIEQLDQIKKNIDKVKLCMKPSKYISKVDIYTCYSTIAHIRIVRDKDEISLLFAPDRGLFKILDKIKSNYAYISNHYGKKNKIPDEGNRIENIKKEIEDKIGTGTVKSYLSQQDTEKFSKEIKEINKKIMDKYSENYNKNKSIIINRIRELSDRANKLDIIKNSQSIIIKEINALEEKYLQTKKSVQMLSDQSIEGFLKNEFSTISNSITMAEQYQDKINGAKVQLSALNQLNILYREKFTAYDDDADNEFEQEMVKSKNYYSSTNVSLNDKKNIGEVKQQNLDDINNMPYSIKKKLEEFGNNFSQMAVSNKSTRSHLTDRMGMTSF
ncbi:MAG: hypothetical protein GY820_22360 [Gammaproteobacteria bacterium]|nr:hypothetical protein [Gammaproteobacteria bacterium]